MKPIKFSTYIDKLNYLNTSYLEVPAGIVKKIANEIEKHKFAKALLDAHKLKEA